MRRGSLVVVVLVIALVGALPSTAAASAPIAVERGNDLFVLDLPGDLRRLTDTQRREHRPAWSPDHHRIAFMLGRRSIAWLDVVSGERHRVIDVAKRFERIDALTWSTDGTQLAYATHTLRGRGPRLCGQAWLVAADGGASTRILANQAMVTGLRFGPDDRWLIASAEWPNGIWVCDDEAPTGVLRFHVDGSHLAQVAETTANDIDLSASGRRVTYRGWLRTCHACGEIWCSAVDGTHAHVIAMPTAKAWGLYEPRFNPSGHRVAMLMSRRGHLSLWIMRADGSRRHLVLHHSGGFDW